MIHPCAFAKTRSTAHQTRRCSRHSSGSAWSQQEPAGGTDAPDLVGARNFIQGRRGVFAPPRQDLGARPERAPGYSAELSRVGRSGPPGRRSAVRIHESMTSKRSDGAPRPKRVRLSPHRRLFVVRLQLRRLLDDPPKRQPGRHVRIPRLEPYKPAQDQKQPETTRISPRRHHRNPITNRYS